MKSQQDNQDLFLEILRNLKRLLRVTQDKEVAIALGLSASRLGNQKKRGTIPVREIIGLCKARGLSLDQVFGLRPVDDEYFYDTHSFIPLYAVEAAAGLDGIANGDYPEPVDKFPFKRSWLQSKHCGTDEKIKKLGLIKIRGDSMEPTIYDGELVLVNTDENVRVPESIKNGGVYVLRWGRDEEGISVKRVHLDWADGLIIAKSDNELYRPKEIRVGDKPLPWYVLGRVIWVGKENI